MAVLNKTIDFFTLGSDRPVRRLLAYYAGLFLLVFGLITLFPGVVSVFTGQTAIQTQAGAVVLQDALAPSAAVADTGIESTRPWTLVMTVLVALLGSLALMLPSSWVYMSARNLRRHNQMMAQTLIILPVVVAGIVFVVRDSLALAFSLAGVVAAVRFRTTLSDARDLVFIFLSIAVGFSAGVQSLAIGALVSILFNFVVLLSWRYDFGRNILAPSSSAKWTEPLTNLAATNGAGHAQVPDRELVLALSPGKAKALADRFERVRAMVTNGKKGGSRYNAVLSVTTDAITDAQAIIEHVLSARAKRWVLDEVINNTGKPSALYYLVKLGKSLSGDQLVTEIRSNAQGKIATADVELCEDLSKKEEAVR